MKGVSRLQFSAICAALLLLTACGSPAILANRAVDFNEAIAEAGDAQLLLNIVRAAYRNPTHYTAVSQLRETRLTEGSLTVTGTFPFGPTAPRTYSLGPSAVVRANEQPGLDLAPLDNRASASGLLRSIEEQTFVDYWQKSWPKDVLLFLLVDDVQFDDVVRKECGLDQREFDLAISRGTIKEVGKNKLGQSRYWIDNNADNFSSLKELFGCLEQKMRYGGGDEDDKDDKDDKDNRPILSKVHIPPRDVLKRLPELQKDFRIKQEGQSSFTIRKSGKKAGLVFTQQKKGPPNATANGPATRVAIGAGGRDKASISLSLRSVDGMIYYLGELVRLQIAGATPETLRRRRIFFKVDIDDPTFRKSVQIDYVGRRFSISREHHIDDVLHGADRTLTVLTIISQLFALYREDKDLPKTTAVQVVGGQ